MRVKPCIHCWNDSFKIVKEDEYKQVWSVRCANCNNLAMTDLTDTQVGFGFSDHDYGIYSGMKDEFYRALENFMEDYIIKADKRKGKK